MLRSRPRLFAKGAGHAIIEDMSGASLLHLLLTFKYGALFVLVIIEGFFSTIAGGALSAQGVMNLFIACVVVIAADMTSDFLYYTFGKKISKTPVARFVGLSPGQVLKVEKLFTRFGPAKTIILAKLSSYLAIPVIVAAGAIHMPKHQFYAYCLAAGTLKTVVLILIGYFFGKEIHNVVHSVIIGSIALSAAIVMYYVGSHVLQTSRKRA
jgi:membrane protein DedA with SNARE-associated domain